MAGLDDNGRGSGETGGEVRDIDFDVAIETVNAFGGEGELFAAASVDSRISAVESDFEIGLGLANDETVGKALAAVAAGVSDANEIGAIGRRGEKEAGVGAKFALTVIIVGVIEREDRQAIGNEFGSGWMGLDDVSRF